jgi:nicotinate phosphoribosyltransferase
LLQKGAPIDGFGIGTHMDTSADAPYLDCAYKLVEYAGRARRKRSEGKVLWPGRKQVYRSYDDDGCMTGDVLSVEGDVREGEPLIRQFMKAGQRVSAGESLRDLRERALAEIKRLPRSLLTLDHAPNYPVTVSEALRNLAQQVDAGQFRNAQTAAEHKPVLTQGCNPN